MDFVATITYASTGQLLVTGTTTGKAPPSFTFEEPAWDLEEAMTLSMQDRYDSGLYSTGSVGSVRDMLHAMSAVPELFGNMQLNVPDDTKKKADEEAEADLQDVGDGIIL